MTGKRIFCFTLPNFWLPFYSRSLGGCVVFACLVVAAKATSGRALLAAGIGISAVIGWMPLPDALLRHMESQYPTPQGSLQPYVGMVVLGGAIGMPYGEQYVRRYTLDASAQRVTAPVALLRQYPHLLLLFSGGLIDAAIAKETSVADAARDFYASMGVSENRLPYERAARNTYENAVLSARVPGVDKTRPWLLVTSAWYMPRSMSLFQREGWNVTPYPWTIAPEATRRGPNTRLLKAPCAGRCCCTK